MNTTRQNKRIFLAVAVALALALGAGCTDRSVPGDQPPWDGSVQGKTDGQCVRPPGGCFSSNDCPQGQECKGCGADPCCPMCTVCYGQCVPAAATTCTDLLKAYDKEIGEAKQCTTGDGPKGPQCTLKVQDRLACGCPTFINPANKSSVTALDSLKKSWTANACHKNLPACPPVPCRNPKGANCTASSPGNPKGSCQDTY